MQNILEKKKNMHQEKSYFRYSIITPVFNCEKYIHKYFTEIYSQTFTHKQNLEIIIIDDGSTDNTVNIIEQWQKKWTNITLVRQQHKGAAAARNAGLAAVDKSDFIIFIDADDFLDRNFLKEVDSYLKEHDETDIIYTKTLSYYEEKANIKDNHSTKKYFIQNKEPFIFNKYDFTMPTMVSLRGVLRKNIACQFKFDENLKLMEDAKYMADILLSKDIIKIKFLDTAIYYNRKRFDNSSATQTLASNGDEIIASFADCLLPLAARYTKADGKSYDFIQKICCLRLYRILQWEYKGKRVSRALENETKKQLLLTILKKLLSYIEYKNFINFSDIKLNKKYRIGFYNAISESVSNSITTCTVEDYDYSQKLLKLFVTSIQEIDPRKLIIAKNSKPQCIKKISISFADIPCLYKYICWYTFSPKSTLSSSGSITYNKVRYNTFSWSILQQEQKKFDKYKIIRTIARIIFPMYNHCCICMDKAMKADDNAEHFYRYLQHRDTKKIYYAISKESYDYIRLKREGFHIINYDSILFKIAKLNCKLFISSQCIKKDYGAICGNKPYFISLGHGITKDNNSNFFNNHDIAMKCVAGYREYTSFINDNTDYQLTAKEVKCTGFARYDRLFNLKKTHNIILIMPTWRKYLTAGIIAKTQERNTVDTFMQSAFAINWLAFLTSKKLKDIANTYNQKIIFYPHFNFSSARQFKNTILNINHIHYFNPQKPGIQKLLASASVVITDYSSIAFDAAYINKNIIYFQFPEKDFTQKHTYTSGYFNYIQDGFGPVCTSADELLVKLEEIFHSEKICGKYIQRCKEFFVYRDNNNCERIYKEISPILQHG